MARQEIDIVVRTRIEEAEKLEKALSEEAWEILRGDSWASVDYKVREAHHQKMKEEICAKRARELLARKCWENNQHSLIGVKKRRSILDLMPLLPQTNRPVYCPHKDWIPLPSHKFALTFRSSQTIHPSPSNNSIMHNPRTFTYQQITRSLVVIPIKSTLVLA
jgi:hypothetical protein